MPLFKSSLVILASIGLLLLGACSNSNQASDSASNQSPTTTETTPKSEPAAKNETSHGGSQAKNAQVVESGAYHLELVPEPEANGTHLDFYLQKGDNHEAIPDAKVTTQVQLPDATQKTLPLTYDAEGKHYTVMLPGKATGQYQLKVTSDIKGEKVEGRFSFNQ